MTPAAAAAAAGRKRVGTGDQVQLAEVVVQVDVRRQQTAVGRQLGDVDEPVRQVALSH